jgi:DNA-binding transcriptional LysR family regulator
MECPYCHREIDNSFIRSAAAKQLGSMYPNYGDWLLKACRRAGFKPRIVKEADGAASALAFVAAGFGVAVVSEPLQKIPAKDVVFRNLTPEDRAWVPVGAAWKPEAISAPVVSQFVDVLAQACAGGNVIAPKPIVV